MEQTAIDQPKWNPATMIAFRFLFVYFLLYILPFPIGDVPYVNLIVAPFGNFSNYVTGIFGAAVFGPAFILPEGFNGSGDKIFNYAQFFLLIAVACVATVVWSILDRKRTHYTKLLDGISVYIRYFLMVMMISYGLAKIVPTQFPFPSADVLNKTYGESSPMRLLWTFMGFSPAYNFFTGLGETIGGLLLFFRRTRLLGALIVTIIMSHVVMLNFAYDVPVKLSSSNYLAMAIFLIAPDLQRLVNLFLLHRPVGATVIASPYAKGKMRWVHVAVKSIFFLVLVGRLVEYTFFGAAPSQAGNRQTSSETLMGDYEVDTFIVNGDTLPPVQSDTRRWKKMSITNRKANIESMDGFTIAWHFIDNYGYRRVTMLSPDLSTSGNFTFTTDSLTLRMKGVLNGDSVRITSIRKSKSPFFVGRARLPLGK